MPLKQKLRILFFLVFCLPGMAIVGYSGKLAMGAIGLSTSGMTATGRIVDYDRQVNRRTSTRFCAVVEFPHDGATYTFTDNWCNESQKKSPVGSSVNVIYEPENPASAHINTFWVLYGKSFFIGLIGTPWLLLGIALVVRVR